MNILDIFSVAVWHERGVQICLRPSFSDPWYHLINHRQQLLHSWQRPVVVCKLFDKLFRSTTLSWCKTLLKTLFLCYTPLFVIVYPKVRCQWCYYSRHPSKKYFKIRFLHLRSILLCQIFCTPFKLTEQERWAIAKMTTWCALYMGALKIFESPWIHSQLLFPKF